MSLSAIPGGLLFPLGFFLFWAFYFTYYRPGQLESRLGSSLSFAAIPTLFLGGVIWLIKVSVVELGELFLFRWWAPKAPVVVRAPVRPPTERFAKSFGGNFGEKSSPAPRPPPPLPEDARRALSIFGLTETRDWNQIHRRYRELAKQFHPDLNPDLTSAGSRFMVYDAAFKTLSGYKVRLFSKRAA